MTDKEIKKALECCTVDRNCKGCPLWECDISRCLETACKNAIDLINRQQAEIERLKAGVKVDLDNFASEYDTKIKAEAIKEFAERLIDLIYEADDVNPVNEWQITNLVQEMVGEE